jgi:predicted CopG family antitoxin
MAVKTITIDIEAYELLAGRKRGGQSFSQVIKAHFGRQPTAGRFLDLVRKASMSTEALAAMERQVHDRRRHRARAVVR